VDIPYGALRLASLPPGSSWTVNQLEAEARAGRQGRIADHLTRLDSVVFNELGYLPFAPAGGQLLFHLVSRPASRSSGVARRRGGRTRALWLVER
jgi:hypothetical protein